MKRIRVFIAVLLSFALLSGCTDTDTVLDGSGDLFDTGYDQYELVKEGKIPHSVLETLDYLLENYTGGMSVPDPEEIEGPSLTDEQIQDVIESTPDVAKSKDDVEAIILKAMSETQPKVSIRIDKSLLAGTTPGDLVLEVLYYRVGAKYIVESLGGVNYWWWSYGDIPGTNEGSIVITFSYFKDDFYDYGFSLDEVKRMKVALKEKAEQLVDELKLNSLSEYEKVYAVNKYLVDTVTYTPGNPPYKMMSQTPYGALFYGDCVCEGYAKAAQLLFNLCGVESYYVTGDTIGGGHAWNLVKVDGKWYQLDITWNDDANMPNQYFLVTDDYMKISRVWDYGEFPPSATEPYKP